MNLTRSQRETLAHRLRAGPWCWPEPGTAEFAEACELVPEGPAALGPGEVPLLTVDAKGFGGSLWGLRLGAREAGPGFAAFEGSARRAWQIAALAVPRSLPLVWSDVRRVAEQPIHAAHLAQHLLRDGAALLPTELTGTSFGLSFVLALTSLVVAQPVPCAWAATAEVTADGGLHPVDGLEAKIAVVERKAPRIRRILVAAAQEDEARDRVGHLEVVPVRSAAQAIRRVFGEDAFSACLAAYRADADQRAEVVDFFFRQAMVGTRRVYVDWGPIARAATNMLGTWTELDGDERWRLDVARGVADRHAGGRSPIAVPDELQLRRFPRPLQVSLVAQLVQHCHDVGAPRRDEIEPYLQDETIFVPLEEGFPPHLSAWGARARLLAVTGRPAEAMVLQERLARAWIARLEYGQTTFQLSEWFRLAGALTALPHDGSREESDAAFRRAAAVHDELSARVGFDLQSASYVDLSRARANVERIGGRTGRIAAGHGPIDQLQTELGHLAADEVYAPWHVRWAATRYRIALYASVGDDAAAARLEIALRAADTGDDGERSRSARRAAILVDLDRALRQGDDAAASAALIRLVADDPGPVRHLLAVADPPGGAAAYVAAYYPY